MEAPNCCDRMHQEFDESIGSEGFQRDADGTLRMSVDGVTAIWQVRFCPWCGKSVLSDKKK